MRSPKIDTSGTEKAQAAIAAAQEAANNLRQNYAADLSNQQLTSAVAGGGADVAAPDVAKLKKRQGTGLSSSLGIM